MMGRYSAVEVIACMFRTGINWGRPIAPGRLIPPALPYKENTIIIIIIMIDNPDMLD